MDTNLFGTLQLTQAALAPLKERDDGRIVMINSMSAVRTRVKFGAYTASKAALAAASKILALELGSYGIRVNGVHPGYIWGESVEQYFHYLAGQHGTTFDEECDRVASETALGYLPPSSEIAPDHPVPRLGPLEADHRPGPRRQRRPLVPGLLTRALPQEHGPAHLHAPAQGRHDP